MSETDHLDFVSGDDRCTTCIGLTYFDAQMRSEKQPSMCFGFRSVEENCNLQEIEKYERPFLDDFYSISCIGTPNFLQYLLLSSHDFYEIKYIGKTVSSGRMDRLGKAPTRIFGIESISLKETRDIGALRVKKTDQRDKILRERQQSLEMKNREITDESNDGSGKVP